MYELVIVIPNDGRRLSLCGVSRSSKQIRWSKLALCWSPVIDEIRIMPTTHAEGAELADARGCNLIRQLIQGYLNLRSAEGVQLESVKGSHGVERTHVRSRPRPLATRFGTVKVNRLTYSAKGDSNLTPLDAALNLPEENYSHGLRRSAAMEASKGSFDEVVEALHPTTGAKVAKHQVEELVGRAAVDFELYYTKDERQRPVDLTDLVVMTFDAKGVVVRKQDLRPAARKAAERQEQKLKKRLASRTDTSAWVSHLRPASSRQRVAIGSRTVSRSPVLDGVSMARRPSAFADATVEQRLRCLLALTLISRRSTNAPTRSIAPLPLYPVPDPSYESPVEERRRKRAALILAP